LTWGDSVEVLAPAALRESIAAIADRMARRYGKTP
jgi:predicted DNA-binding transcriptional regulator YafY